jgi:hypothetical protein
LAFRAEHEIRGLRSAPTKRSGDSNEIEPVIEVDPMAGALLVFSSRRRKALKCLVFDRQGFWLCQQRLSPWRFAWWPTDAKPPTFGLDAH